MEQIPMIGDIDLNTLVDSNYYKVYPTEVHKQKDSPWFFTGMDLRQVIKLSKEYTNYLMWGHGNQ